MLHNGHTTHWDHSNWSTNFGSLFSMFYVNIEFNNQSYSIRRYRKKRQEFKTFVNTLWKVNHFLHEIFWVGLHLNKRAHHWGIPRTAIQMLHNGHTNYWWILSVTVCGLSFECIMQIMNSSTNHVQSDDIARKGKNSKHVLGPKHIPEAAWWTT